MARLYRAFENEVRGFVKQEFESIDDQNYRKVSGDIVEYTNENGTFAFKKHEVGDVIREMIQQEMLNNVETKVALDSLTHRMENFVSEYISDMEKRLENFFYEKVDEVAENLYLRALDSKIEDEVNKRLENKIDWITKNYKK
jgi:uncharacterized membrane protein YheB (UPF0754 family)